MSLRTQIVRAAYDGIEFPVVEAHDENSHAYAEHKAWRVDGADVQHTGREPLRITLKIALLNSFSGWPRNLFPDVHDQLEDKFRTSPQGTLTHPYYGQVIVQVVKWSRSYDPQIQQGVMIDAEFLERNASAYRSFANFEPEPSDALTQAATTADTEIETIGAQNQRELSPIVKEQLAYLEEDDRSSDEAYSALRVIQDAAQANIDSEELSDIDGHAAREACRAVIARSWDYARAYLTPRSQPRMYSVPQQMSLARVAALVYGDPSKTDVIRKANRIPDEAFVPMGTVLVLPE